MIREELDEANTPDVSVSHARMTPAMAVIGFTVRS